MKPNSFQKTETSVLFLVDVNRIVEKTYLILFLMNRNIATGDVNK